MNNNVNLDEIAHFDHHAKDWWDDAGAFKTLHHINPVRLQFIVSAVNLQGKTVLDVGCGGGILSEALAQAGGTVTGLDRSAGAIAAAREHASQRQLSIDYQQQDISAFAAMHRAHFDVITCLELLEHVPEPDAIVRATAQALKPGGHVFFSTINRNPKSFLQAIVGAEYILRLIPRGTHHYASLIKPSELHAWLRQAKLMPQRTQGMWYQPFSGKAGLHDDVSVNYLVHAIKPA